LRRPCVLLLLVLLCICNKFEELLVKINKTSETKKHTHTHTKTYCNFSVVQHFHVTLAKSEKNFPKI
jgi:hypothetical protein